MSENIRKWLPIAISVLGLVGSLALEYYFQKRQEKYGLKLDPETIEALKKGNPEVLGD